MPSVEQTELDTARASILEQAGAVVGAVALCEPEGIGGAYRPSAWTPDPFWIPEGSLPQGSVLVRWLGANRRPLPVPDPTGVFDDLTDHDRERLRAWHVTACVPLCHSRALVAWLAVRTQTGHQESRRDALMLHAPRWAALLAEARETAAEHEQTEAVGRVQRLGMAGTLATQIAHEVRNPLAAARSATQLVLDGKVEVGEHSGLLGGVLRDIDRATAALTHLLHLGRPHPWDVAVCDLAHVAREAVDFTHALARRRGITVMLEVADAPARILGSGSALSQVLVNLIMNACQASQPGQAVVVLLERDPERGGIQVQVIDQGIGIPDDQLARICDAFFTTKPDGGGLGLTISRNVVEQHHGTLRFKSAVGRGTTVTVILPAAEV